MSSAIRYPVQRLEVLSMWFTNKSLSNNDNNNNNNNNNDDNKNKINNSSDSDSDMEDCVRVSFDELKDTYKIDKDPGYFKGRIFIADTFLLHEIYNSEKEDHIYADVQTKKSFKRKRLDSVSGYTDLPVTNKVKVLESGLLRKISKQKSGDSTSGLIDLLPESPSEKGSQESSGTSQILESESDQTTELLLMGPNSGMMTSDSFEVIVHPDCGKPDIEKLYVDHANSRYFGGRGIQTDYFDFYNITPDSYNKSSLFTLDCASRSLTLECIAYSDAKAVHLEVRWLKQDDRATDDGYMICGRLTVSNNISEKESVLFETPLNKAIYVPHGKPIALLKSVIVVPYDSCYHVNAELHRFNIASSELIPIVNGSARFPHLADEDDFTESSFSPDFHDDREACPSEFYKFEKHIDGIDGGRLEVTAFVDIQ